MYHFLNYRIDFDTPGSTIVQFKEFQKSKKKKKQKQNCKISILYQNNASDDKEYRKYFIFKRTLNE